MSDTIQRIPVAPQGAHPIDPGHYLGRAESIAHAVWVAMQSKCLGGDFRDVAMMIEAELAFARFQGYREAMRDDSSRAERERCMANFKNALANYTEQYLATPKKDA